MGKPEVAAGHRGDDVRLADDLHVVLAQPVDSLGHGCDMKVDHRTGRWRCRLAEADHEPDACTVEERHIGYFEKKTEAQEVAVESGGQSEVAYWDGELFNSINHAAKIGRRRRRRFFNPAFFAPCSAGRQNAYGRAN